MCVLKREVGWERKEERKRRERDAAAAEEGAEGHRDTVRLAECCCSVKRPQKRGG